MISPEHLTTDELTNYARMLGDDCYLAEIGRRVVDQDICIDDGEYCEHEKELMKLRQKLEEESNE